MRNVAFDPPSVTVAVGDTVVWTNADFLPHTATARDAAWDSKAIEANGVWRLVAATPGTHEYYCVFHPSMKGTIVVR
jgi:plastocyanin